MLTISVKAILTQEYFVLTQRYFKGKPDHTIYFIRDGSTVIYIGKSKSPLKRLFRHFGRSSRPSTFYLDYKPYARAWTVELYTTEECRQITGKHCRDSMHAEIAMIQHFHPCANTIYNFTPSRYPAHYRSCLLNLDNNAVDYLNF